MPDEVESTSKLRYYRFDTHTAYVTIQNTGTNTLWLSLDRRTWHHVMSGTSWDLGINVQGFYHCTQTGRTYFAVIGLQRNLVAGQASLPAGDELETMP
jgi:hypothetical protein